jgi:ABC-2 type transport system permease protein
MSSATPVSQSAAQSVAQVRQPQHRSSGLAALGALYLLTLRQYVHGKRWMVIGLLFLLPPGLAILLRTLAPRFPADGLEFLIVYMLVPQALLPLLGLVYASGIIQDEQEEQTLTYLLIRPISKWGMYLVKLLATLTTTVALTAFFTVLTYAAIYVGSRSEEPNVPLRCLQSVGIHSLAVVAYCCLFGLMSLLTKRTLMVGIVYIVAIEGVLANLPFGIRLVTVIYYARIIAFRSLDFVIEGPRGDRKNIAAEAWQLNLDKDPKLLEHPELSTSITILVVASLVCALLAAFMCSRREFYVKTPEKN